MADTPYRVGHMHAKPFRIGRLLARIGVLLSAWTMAASAPLHAQAAEGRGVVVSTHDVEFVALVADAVVVMAEGEVVSAGDVGKVLAESPAFAPQTAKVLGPGWLTVADVAGATS